VEVRVEPDVAVGALDDGYGAGLTGRQTAVDAAAPIPPCDRICEDAQHFTEEFPVEGEWEAQGERHREHELSQRNIGQDAIHQV